MSTGLPRVGLLVCLGVFSACGGGRIEGGVSPASACGNGALDAGEACDDGDAAGGDGCAADCTSVEVGYTCPTPGGDCVPSSSDAVCGNGVREGAEACDDGDTAGGDGCAADCASIETGYTCPPAGGECTHTPAAVCGNGVREGAEACDDGDTAGGDGCAADCASIEPGYTCPPAGGECSQCGNGLREGGEACDDGNTRAGDGCASDCASIESGYTCPTEGERCLLTAACGNGQLDWGESCDDGNTDGNDGCAADCSAVTAGYACPIPGVACVPLDQCGNGIVDDGEVCDPGIYAGVGCAADCSAVDPGWACPVPGEACIPIDVCGNGIVEHGEACDDGNVDGGDGCAADCLTIEAGHECPPDGGACVAADVCGNGFLDSGEACDDGNASGGDGCAADCTAIEAGWVCPAVGAACVQANACGNGILDTDEGCDDGDAVSGDGCSSTCTVEPGFVCPAAGADCVLENWCGNGIVESGEACDDGNRWSGDGCAADCLTIETSHECPPDGGACVPADVCGNGLLDSGEGCDDGNAWGGDGCSSTCTVETGYLCPTPGEPCVDPCGDGALDSTAGEQCDDGNRQSYDGCSSACAIEAGWACPTPAQPCAQTCGNGNPDPGEDCDFGTASNTGSYDPAPHTTCTPICKWNAYCGDNHPDAGHEACDLGTAGNTGSYGGCNADCTLAAYCGDGVKNGTEQCDDPAGNTGAYGGCNADCTLAPRCGDGDVSGVEACDLGGRCSVSGAACVLGGPACTDGGSCVSLNTGAYNGCKSDCTLAPRCGDSIVQAANGETCDDGKNDGSYGGCTASCQRAAYCGDGLQNGSEQCDYGTAGNDGSYAGCMPDCTVAGYCGDGNADVPYEECDDGALNTNAYPTGGYPPSCQTNCRLGASCGDGKVNNPPESCDDRNRTAGDGCSSTCALEDGFACPTPGAACVPTCGNGRFEAGEKCDDGNRTSGDGCSGCSGADCPAVGCQVEAGWSCPQVGACRPLCGNGVLDSGEKCDDGNATSGDGCSGYTGSDFSTGCQLEPDFECPTPGLACNRICGNGRLDSGEQCDLGTAANTGAYGGCNPDCTIAGYCGDGAPNGPEQCDLGGACSDGVPCELRGAACLDGSTCVSQNDGAYDGCRSTCTFGPRCGDGLVTDGETCDDGNASDADGCSAACQLEPGYVCGTPGQPCALDVCGNRSLDPYEACDDGKQCADGLTQCSSDAECAGIGDGTCLARSGDGCRADCLAVEPGWDCTSIGMRCVASRCGDGIVAGWEQCDDGNATAGDGCSTTCTIEAGYSCPTAGAPCISLSGPGTTCGNATLEPGEQCDDGNTTPADGCSATCQVEPGYACPTLGAPCRPTTCGDGTLEGSEQCDDGNTTSGDGCSGTCTVETGSSCPTPGALCGPIGATCGDDKLQPGEQCDDGKSCYDGTACATDSDCAGVTCTPGDATVGCDTRCRARGGDGCDPSCRIENIYACDPTGNCQPVCGDGITVAAAGEECDDGNTTSGDGCSASCKIETGYTCTNFKLQNPPTITTPLTIRDVRGWNQTSAAGDGYQYTSAKTYPCSGGTCYGHPDFESYSCGSQTTGLVQGTLAVDGKPVWTGYKFGAGGCGCPTGNPSACGGNQQITGCQNGGTTAECASTFDQWYEDVASVNQSTSKGLTLRNTGTNAAGQTVYQWDSRAYNLDGTCCDGSTPPTCTNMTACAGFFPIDGQLYGDVRSLCLGGTNAGATCTRSTDCNSRLCVPHNFGFTSEFHAFFQYKGGETLSFSGDDDVWVFVNDKLALDLGGLHPRVAGSFTLSQQRYEFLGRCSGGSRAGQACKADVDCPGAYAYTYASCAPVVTACSGAGADAMCPAGDTCCRGACVGGGSKGQSCLADGDCGGSFCGTGTCLAGSNLGNPCRNNTDCGGSACGAGSCTLGQCAGPAVRDLHYDLYQGGIYEISMFHAERHTDASNYWLTLTGFVNTGKATCAPTCGDGLIRGSETCDDGNQTAGDGCSATCQIDSGWNCAGSPSVCFKPVCGDGVVTYPEQCDDHNSVGGDGCSATCQFEHCGDGIVDSSAGEQCDEGSLSNGLPDHCTTACRQPTCGDHLVDQATAPWIEQCDPGGRCTDGSACSVVTEPALYGDCRDGSTCQPDPTSATCTSQCLMPACGDGIVTPPEVCDDGASNGLYGHCNNGCTAEGPFCGDGAVNGTEECDFGTSGNDGAYNGCNSNCTVAAYCGDGSIDGPEQCDGGPDCNPDCTLVAVCGDAFVNPYSEDCDFGTAGNTGAYDPAPLQSCTATCDWGPFCGDHVRNGPEGCDLGSECADGSVCMVGATSCSDGSTCTSLNVGGYGGCNADCRLAEHCGDGVTNGTEQCDFGGSRNDGAYGGCDFECKLAGFCGDGAVQPAYEQCDLGTADNTGAYGGCNGDCTLPARCGDGVVQPAESETCDDGINDGSYGGCTSACQRASECGDGIIDASAGEQCDDGGKCSDGTACVVGGTPCADGTQCVPQNDGRYGGCRSNCRLASKCGDGLVDTAAGEACDGASFAGKTCTDLDGDGTSGSGDYAGGMLACTSTCQLDTSSCYRCGDGVKNGNEACDGVGPCGTAADCGEPPATCDSLGFPDVTGLGCKADCTFDLSGCNTSSCGNDSLDPGEQCDGTHLGTATCESLGYAGGSLSCNADCTLNSSGCQWCGDGVMNGAETCDSQDLGDATCQSLGKGYVGGRLGCNSTCDGFDESGCWECASCGDCGLTEACVDHRCGGCNTTADCCSPMVCFLGTCTQY